MSTESAPSVRRKYLLFTIFAVISFALDQWTKILARHHLRPLGSRNAKVVVEGCFDLRYAENPGVAFSMLQDIPGGRVLLTLLAVGAFLLVLYYLRKTPIDNTRLHIALGLVGGGAIGNLVDRVIYGKVTDFIVWKVSGLMSGTRMAGVQHRRCGAVHRRRADAARHGHRLVGRPKAAGADAREGVARCSPPWSRCG